MTRSSDPDENIIDPSNEDDNIHVLNIQIVPLNTEVEHVQENVLPSPSIPHGSSRNASPSSSPSQRGTESQEHYISGASISLTADLSHVQTQNLILSNRHFASGDIFPDVAVGFDDVYRHDSNFPEFGQDLFVPFPSSDEIHAVPDIFPLSDEAVIAAAVDNPLSNQARPNAKSTDLPPNHITHVIPSQTPSPNQSPDQKTNLPSTNILSPNEENYSPSSKVATVQDTIVAQSGAPSTAAVNKSSRFQCPYCQKKYKEERHLRSHVTQVSYFLYLAVDQIAKLYIF